VQRYELKHKIKKEMERTLIIGKIALKRREREARELAIYRDYEAAVAAGSYKTDVNRSLMDKYHIRSISTLYFIRRRVQERLNDPQQNAQYNS
jgi:hypothetical protein